MLSFEVVRLALIDRCEALRLGSLFGLLQLQLRVSSPDTAKVNEVLLQQEETNEDEVVDVVLSKRLVLLCDESGSKHVAQGRAFDRDAGAFDFGLGLADLPLEHVSDVDEVGDRHQEENVEELARPKDALGSLENVAVRGAAVDAREEEELKEEVD